MQLHKFFVNQSHISGDKVRIIEDASHISRVLRLNAGDEILIFDGNGFEYDCILNAVDKNECIAIITGKRPCRGEPKTKTTLFQGVPKSGKMELIIQKCVELGISEIYPVITKYTVVKFDSEKDKRAKAERWQKVAIEAAKQCGRGIVPTVHLPIEFYEAVATAKKLDLIIMPYEILGGKKDLRNVLSNNINCETIGFFIGPEGGFDEAEAEFATANNVQLVGLGERILRTETAAITVAAIIMYENNEL